MFTTINLSGERVLIKGQDAFGTEGQEVLDASQWLEIYSHQRFDDATDAFNQAVEEFFAPLLVAADAQLQAKAGPPQDPTAYVVLSEGVEAVEGQPAHVVRLTRDSQILRLMEDGDTDRLIWVNDTLEILEYTGEPVTEDEAVANVAEVLQGITLD